MRRVVVCLAILLAACGEPEPPAAAPAAPAPSPVSEAALPDVEPAPAVRPKPPPLPGAPVGRLVDASSPMGVIEDYLAALRSGDVDAARKLVVAPGDEAGTDALDASLDRASDALASGERLEKVVATRSQGTWAVAIVRVEHPRAAPVRRTVEARFLRREGGRWRLRPGDASSGTNDPDHAALLDWYEGTRAEFE